MKVGCGFCGNWFHTKGCADISTELWDTLNKEKQLHWYCDECNEIAPEVLILVQKCVKENIEIKRDIIEMKEELKEELKDIREGKDELFIESVKKIAKEIVNQEREKVEVEEVIPAKRETMRVIAKEAVQENNDKKGREANLVISYVDETKEAEEEVTDMLTFLDVSVEVKGIRRMGREKKENVNRPIWVNLGSKRERNSVLEKAKNLKDDIRWKHVYINRDMTENERKEAYQLRVELRERRREEGTRGQSNFIIRRGRVINKAENDRETRTPRDGIQLNNQANNRTDTAAAEEQEED